MRALPLLLLAALTLGGEATRAEREAAALAAVLALPDGPRRDAGLAVVRSAWRAFREDAAAAAAPPPADAGEARRARLADLAARQAAAAAILGLAGTEPARIPALARAHLARWPLDDEVRAALGLALLAAGDRDGALAELLAVMALDPACTAARELRGRLHLGAEDPVVAAQAVADLAPRVGALLAAGAAAEAAGDGEAAERALAALAPLAAAVRGGDLARLAALRAGAAERAGDGEAALALWRTAAGGGVTQPDPAPRLAALVRRLRADRIGTALAAGAVDDLAELSPAFPERDDIQDRLFRLLLSGGRLGEARDAALRLLAAAPEHPLAGLVAEGARAGIDPGRLTLLPPLRARLAAAAPEVGKRFPVVHGLAAVLAELAGDIPAAAAALDPLLAARPEDDDARFQRARLRLAAGDAAGALADAEAVAARRPDDASLLALRGRIRAAQGDAAGALADAERVLALRPGTAGLLARARIRAALGDGAGVLDDLAQMAAAAADAGDSLLLMEALPLAEAGRDAGAVEALLTRAAQLGNIEAAQRLRRLRR